MQTITPPNTPLTIIVALEEALQRAKCLKAQKLTETPELSFASKAYFQRRKAVLQTLRQALWASRNHFAEIIAKEMHKPVHEALETDVLTAISICDGLTSATLHNALKPVLRGSFKMLAMGRMTWLHRRPLGIVGVITPWNYPLGTPMSAIGSAWLCGNQVLLKPSEYTPQTAQYLVALWHEALTCHGFSTDEIQCLDASRETGEQLVRHPDMDGFCFTGSSAVGAFIRQQSGHRPCVLELGGSDPAIFLPSLPKESLDDAVRHVVWSRFSNAGQTCAATKRLWIPASLRTRIYEALRLHVGRLRVGDPFDPQTQVGPLVSWSQQEKAHQQKTHALAHGASILVEAPLPQPTTQTDTLYPYFAPCVLIDVQDHHQPWQEEVFAPLLSVRVYDDNALEEVLRAEITQHYALGASVWGDDEEALRVAEKLPASQVGINETVMPWYAIPTVPWLASGRSGQGARHAQEGMHSLTRPQIITENLGWSLWHLLRKAPWLFQDSTHDMTLHRKASAEAICGSFTWGKLGHPFKLQWLWYLIKRFM
jgi:acyl-CoA reductase-like NAD-dependent aldehyde dehydrogenase